MIKLGVSEESNFMASSIERDRNLSGYTVDTLQEFQATYPGVAFDMIVGADQAQVFDTWHEPLEILKMSRLLVGVRPGYPVSIPKGLDHSRISVVSIDPVDVSSSEIRRRVAAGAPKSDLVSLVPQPVADYIVSHNLYRK